MNDRVVIIPTYNEKENIERIYVRLHSLNMKMALSINVQSVEEQKKTESIWNSVSVLNVTETTSTVRIIYIHIYTRSKRRKDYYEKSTICHKRTIR